MSEWVANLGLWWYVIFFMSVQFVNVVLNTLKTIITSRGKKIPAAIINAITFGFYTLVVALTANLTNLWVNMIITIITNLIGVYFSIWLLEKIRKDKLWEITATVNQNYYKVANELHDELIPYTMIKDSTGYYVFNIYSSNQYHSKKIKEILTKYNAKYIVHQEEVRL